jgi:O-succinylbenzoic acid--CoA ligase
MSSLKLNNTIFNESTEIEIDDIELQEYLKFRLKDPEQVQLKTSGSTGTPSEVTLNVSSMQEHAGYTCEFFGINSRHNLLLALPIGFIAGKMMVERAIYSGANLIRLKPHLNPIDGIYVSDTIHFAAFTPAQISAMLETEAGQRFLQSVSNVLIGGAPIDSYLESKLKDYGISAFFSYGMTETISHVAIRELGSIFYQPLHQSIRFETDQRGCLAIRAPYLGDNVLITNDIVELNESGNFRWIGRADFIINSGGVKLYPEQIENKLASVLSGREFLVGSITDSRFGERPVLVVSGIDKIPNIQEILEDNLTRFEQPVQVIYTKELPALKNQKPDRIALREIIKKAGRDSPCFKK